MTLFGGRITVRTEPFFWLVMLLFGASLGRGAAEGIVLWTGVLVFSVFAHELGHAAVCLMCGTGADIALQGFGGATLPRDPKPFENWWRRAALDLSGCAAGFGVAAAAFGVLFVASMNKWPLSPTALELARALVAVNIWFSLFNLLPITPMDGGRLVAGLLSARWGVNGRRAAHVLGLVLGTAAAIYFYRGVAFYAALMCGAMAFGEGRALKRSLAMTPADSDPAVTGEPGRAAELWDRGRRDEAIAALVALREKTGAGLTFEAATLQLAVYEYLLGRYDEAYALFKEGGESELSPPAKHAYADAAYRKGDFATALRLGRSNFHDQPGADTALAAALAAAGTKDAHETVSWLRTGLRHGLDRSELRAKEFDAVRGSEEFREYLGQ